jgi:hypothetical protein
MMTYINDKDVWPSCPTDYLWIYDKLILARKLGHIAGPAGVPVPRAAWYIVRPITNIRMMSRGAQRMWLTPESTELVPDGYFWCEEFSGRHISVDYHWGIQTLAVEGFRDSSRLDRFCRWQRIEAEQYPYPQVLGELWMKTPWINVEQIGTHIIEVHLRWNDDFDNHAGTEIFPQWQDATVDPPPGTTWYPSVSADRTGFWIR